MLPGELQTSLVFTGSGLKEDVIDCKPLFRDSPPVEVTPLILADLTHGLDKMLQISISIDLGQSGHMTFVVIPCPYILPITERMTEVSTGVGNVEPTRPTSV